MTVYRPQKLPIGELVSRLERATNAPSDWRELAMYICLHGKKIEHFTIDARVSDVEGIYTFREGLVLRRSEDRNEITLVTMTIFQQHQVISHFMTFTLEPFKALTGGVNCFDFWYDVDDDYVHHKVGQYSRAAENEHAIEWDIVKRFGDADAEEALVKLPKITTVPFDENRFL